ncbi:BPI fold-containing family B member 2-like [Rhinatrema bivittatum]|uniref:BPI fold-containing family B member 2-like n=1 Tax=Rhinatrema bivittatum TaxID=194408 RepID=UPI001127D5CF|nr:BPI fold-containing family B member 2-like [Rhinatrema bivittatum]
MHVQDCSGPKERPQRGAESACHREAPFRSGEMFQICAMAIVLGLFAPSQGMEVGPDILMRLNQQAADFVGQTQRGLFRDVLATIPIPNFSSGGVLGVNLNILSIQIKTVDVVQLSVELVPETKGRLTFEADLYLEAKNLLTVLELKLQAQIVAEVDVSRGSEGCPVATIIACSSVLGEMQVVSLGILSAPLDLLQEHLHGVFSDQLCLKMSAAFDLMNTHLEDFSALSIFGAVSQIQYTLTGVPAVTSEIIDFSLNVQFYLSSGILDLGLAPVSFSLPAPTNSSGPLLSLALTENVFILLYTTIQEWGQLDIEITGQMLGDESKLTTATLSTAIPKINELYPVPLPVILEIVVARAPVVTLEANNLTLHLMPSVDVRVKLPAGDTQSLLTLDAHVFLSVALQIVHGKLSSSAVLIGDVSLSLLTSSIDSVNVSQLQSLIGDALINVYLQRVNAALSVGLTLPTLLSLDLDQPIVAINPGFALLSFALQ